MTDFSYLLVAKLSLTEFISASAGFVDLFPVQKSFISQKMEFDLANNLAVFSLISSLPLDEDAIWAFERGLRCSVARENLLSYFNHPAGLNPTHFTSVVVKIQQYPSLFMEAVHHKLSLERYGLNCCNYVIQKFPDDYVAICFHSLEDGSGSVKQLITDSLDGNQMIFSFEI